MEELKIFLSKNDISSEYFIKNLQLNYDSLLNKLLEELKEFLKADYFYMENTNVYYDKNTVSLFPIFEDYLKKDFQRNNVESLLHELEYFSTGNGLSWDFLTLEEVKKSFSQNIHNPHMFSKYYLKFINNNTLYLSYKNENEVLFYYTFSDSSDFHHGTLIPIHRLKNENSSPISNKEMLTLWLQNKLLPAGLNKKTREDYLYLFQEF